MQLTTILLWTMAAVSALLMSIGFAMLSLVSSPDKRGDAMQMLPAYLQPGAARSRSSTLFMVLMGVAMVGFYGSLLALFLIGPPLAVLIGAALLFVGKFALHGWWVRNADCRPMQPFWSWSKVLVLLALATLASAVI